MIFQGFVTQFWSFSWIVRFIHSVRRNKKLWIYFLKWAEFLFINIVIYFNVTFMFSVLQLFSFMTPHWMISSVANVCEVSPSTIWRLLEKKLVSFIQNSNCPPVNWRWPWWKNINLWNYDEIDYKTNPKYFFHWWMYIFILLWRECS